MKSSRHWTKEEYLKVLRGERKTFQPHKYRSEWVDGALLVDRNLLEFALREGKQTVLATYCRWRHENWNNGGFVDQSMLKTNTQRIHLTWMVKNGWVRKIRCGVYQIVAMRDISKKYGTCKTAALMTLEDWEDPMSSVFGAWLSCFAKTWKNKLDGIALADALKSEHFVIAASGYLSSILGVTKRTIANWKKRAWKMYWQKESVKYVVHRDDPTDYGTERNRAGFRVLLGPNVYYRFTIPAVKTKRVW